ncbi:hypothetical protein [Hyphomonas sp.]|uniref:hypothetical protein n=1 Tax=Hyphomonas sp. TaxID=87 RepID=UPI000C897372|nr:hypothetical protein [Hyphomonas sp.]MAL47319.1 hypothetical protein [Hyphomonas sp.]|tara:strand:- start:875 stop:1117 length:243 start_codon:yes stop_codon:yes gene_type:complete
MKRYIKKLEKAVEDIMEGKEVKKPKEEKPKVRGFMAPTKLSKETDLEASEKDIMKKMAGFIADIRKKRMELKDGRTNDKS